MIKGALIGMAAVALVMGFSVGMVNFFMLIERTYGVYSIHITVVIIFLLVGAIAGAMVGFEND